MKNFEIFALNSRQTGDFTDPLASVTWICYFKNIMINILLVCVFLKG